MYKYFAREINANVIETTPTPRAGAIVSPSALLVRTPMLWNNKEIHCRRSFKRVHRGLAAC